MKPVVLPRDPDRVLLSTLAGEVPTGFALMSVGIKIPLPLLIKHPNNNSLGDSSVGVDLEAVDVVGVLTLVSPSLTSIRPINDNYCVGPTPIQVNPVQLDPKSAMVFSRAQDVDKLNLETVVSKTVNPIVTQALQLDVSYHVVPHVHIVSLHGHPQKKGLSPDQTVSKIKHVKGVCCVNPCLSVPPVPNVPNAVVEQCVGGRLQRFGQVWQAMGANPRVVCVLREGYTLPFKQRPLLTRSPLVLSGYASPVKNQFLKEALLGLMNKLVVEKVVVKSSLAFYN